MGKTWKKRRLRKLKLSNIETTEILEDSQELEQFPNYDLTMKKDKLIQICESVNLSLDFESLTKRELCDELDKLKSKNFEK